MSLTGKTCSLTSALIKKVKNFDKIILNILTNDGPFRTITCNDRDPPWLKDKIKTLIEEKMHPKKHPKNFLRIVNINLII